MKRAILSLIMIFIASYSLEQPPSPKSCSPRELSIQGKVSREYQQSKKGQIKTETLSATFVSGKKISITFHHTKNKYTGFIQKENTKTEISPQSAQKDFDKLKIAFLQNEN